MPASIATLSPSSPAGHAQLAYPSLGKTPSANTTENLIPVMEAAKAAGVDQNDDVTRGRTFWYAKLTFKDNAARDKMIQLVSEQAEYGFEHEHGTLKYGCLTSAENPDDPFMWAMEDYANGHAIRFHSSADRMKPVFGYIGSGVMVSPLQKTTVEFFKGLEILKPEIAQVDHPIVQIMDIDLKAPLSPEEVKLWSSVVEAANKEPHVLFFGIGLSSGNDSRLITITAYTSQETFNDSKVKIKGAAQPTLAALESKMGEIKTDLLELKGGFLYKELKA